MISKHILRASALTAMAMAGMGIAAPSASASAASCTNTWGMAGIQSCISVHGSGTHVKSVQGGVLLAQFKKERGYFTISDTRGLVRITTPVENFNNRNGVFKHVKWGTPYNINRNLPKGDQLCAAFHKGTVKWARACATVG